MARQFWHIPHLIKTVLETDASIEGLGGLISDARGQMSSSSCLRQSLSLLLSVIMVLPTSRPSPWSGPLATFTRIFMVEQ